MRVPTVCPLCKHRMGEPQPRCPDCRGDLGPLVQVIDAANRKFNEGVRWARKERWRLAAEAFSAALALNPGDEEAKELLDMVRNNNDRGHKVG
ncbi:hypothetical protein F4561_003770 [Lipingzhangella halophila]|uniref:Tetratricopeptide repeat protein n=1 Tax=Lipingzhangella halophila TaxID=1783352 RepID=A0A7W7RJ62_9ACTN|nr:hypothetical protein [Lipingzhangella halophila]MBB4932950.1 hypothetical protein [Lipingzhangella halophila]